MDNSVLLNSQEHQTLIITGSIVSCVFVILVVIIIVVVVCTNKKRKNEKFEMIRDGKVFKEHSYQKDGKYYAKTTLGDKTLEDKELGNNNINYVANAMLKAVPDQTFKQFQESQRKAGITPGVLGDCDCTQKQDTITQKIKDTVTQMGTKILDDVDTPAIKTPALDVDSTGLILDPMDPTADNIVKEQSQKENYYPYNRSYQEVDDMDYSQQQSALFGQANNLLIQQNDNLANNLTQQDIFMDRQIKTYITAPQADINQIEQVNRNSTAQQQYNHLQNAATQMSMMLAPAPISGQAQGGLYQKLMINSNQPVKKPQSIGLTQFQNFNTQGFFRNMIGEKALKSLENKQIQPMSNKDITTLKEVIKVETPVTQQPIVDDKQRTLITSETVEEKKNGDLSVTTKELPIDAITDAMDTQVKDIVQNTVSGQENFGRFTADRRQAIAKLMTVYFIIAEAGYQDQLPSLQEVAELFPNICKFYGKKCTPQNIQQMDAKNKNYLQQAATNIPNIQTIKNFIQTKYDKPEIITKIDVPAETGETVVEAVSVDADQNKEKYGKIVRVEKYGRNKQKMMNKRKH